MANAQNVRTQSNNGVQFTAPPPPKGLAPPGTPFDKHDISGKWNRATPFETYSNVPGGVPTGRNGIDANGGQQVEEAPFTPAGQEALLKNLPSYGRRQVAPRLGNDPQMMCDPMGVPRILNGQVKDPHATFEIVVLPDRMLELVQWHHEMREVWTDGRKLPKLDDELESKVERLFCGPLGRGHLRGRIGRFRSQNVARSQWLSSYRKHAVGGAISKAGCQYAGAPDDGYRSGILQPKPFKSDVKRFLLDRVGVKDWDEQIYCVPSEEFKFNSLIRDGGAGKQGK